MEPLFAKVAVVLSVLAFHLDTSHCSNNETAEAEFNFMNAHFNARKLWLAINLLMGSSQADQTTAQIGQFAHCQRTPYRYYCFRESSPTCPGNLTLVNVFDTFSDCCKAARYPVKNTTDGCEANEGDLRLYPTGSNYGFIQVNYFDQWGAICDDFVDQETAEALCRFLGLPSTNVTFSSHNNGIPAGFPNPGPPSAPVIWLDDLECRGSDEFIEECETIPFGEEDCTEMEELILWCF